MWIRGIVLILVGTLVGCSGEIEIKSTELTTIHDPSTDSMHVFLRHDDVTGVDPVVARTKLSELLLGRREFLLGAYPFHVDLDSVDKTLPSKKLDEPRRSALKTVLAEVGRPEAGLGTAKTGELIGYQRTTIRNWTRFVVALNTLVFDAWVEEGLLDAKKDAALRDYAWIRFDDGWSVEIPLDTADKLRLLRVLASTGSPRTSNPEAFVVHEILDNLRKVEPTPKGVRLSFGTRSTGDEPGGKAWTIVVDAPVVDAKAKGDQRRLLKDLLESRVYPAADGDPEARERAFLEGK